MDAWSLLRLRCVVVLALLLVALATLPAAGAQAATPIPIGDGRQPAVAVDGAGTAYIAWIGAGPDPTPLYFCRLPRGAAACAVATTIATPGTSLTRPFVQVDGNVVRVLSYRYGLTGDRFDADFLFTSTDGGATFDAGLQVGITPFVDAVRGPGAAISLVTHAVTQGEFYQRVPTDGTSAGESRALLSTTHLGNGTVALVDPATPLVVFADGASNAQFRRYSGVGDPNDAANWTPAQDIGYADWPHLAGGPRGVFLLAEATDNSVFVRRFEGTGFGAPVTIPGARGEGAQSYLAQDPAGRLHMLLPQITAAGSRLLYATSDNGAAWLQTTFAFEPLANQVRAALAADSRGFAVWENSPGSAARVFALPIGPSAAKPAFRFPRRAPATAKRQGSGVTVSVRGRLPVPAGTTRREACRGRLAFQVKRGRTTLARRNASLTRTCGFATRMRTGPRGRGARRVRLIVRFRGNPAVAPITRTYTLKVR